MKPFGFIGYLVGKFYCPMKNKSISLALVYTWLFIFGFLPIILVLLTSFLTADTQNLVSWPLTIKNYSELISSIFGHVFLRSLIISIITTIGCLLIAYPFSYLLVKSRHQSVLLLLIIIPFWTSSLVRTYSLIAILKFNGLLNQILIKLHLINEPLALLYTNFAVISGLIYNLFPFMVLPIFNNMERFDFRLIEAAKDLGASRLNIFFKVFLPNTLRGVFSGSLLVFLPAMTLFYIPNVLGGARSTLVGNLILSQFLITVNWPQGAATSVLLTGLLLILLLVFKIGQKRGLR